MDALLPENATLRDVVASLDKPESFVRQVLGTIHEGTKAHGPIVIRLGVTGKGRTPNYRLESAGNGEPIMAIDGANHKPWRDGDNFSGATTWSTEVMTKDEVASLLGEIRGYSRPKRTS